MAAPLMALQQAPEVYRQARAGASWVADAAGFTEEEDYRGLVALALIAYAGVYLPLKQPIKDLRTIQLQIVGVLDQLYKWLGGAESAVGSGVKAVTNAPTTIANALSSAASTLERWV